MKPTKAERREKVKDNQSKMGVSGKSVFILRRIKVDKANKK